ncbi:extracellular calcium-sensing receptor-like [Protopterus annectens]|uniref:extracellular calcium-sensing receptor-like n=1 Tax=Protopterus annectens TaxID=7888 RepID=UPI001CFBEAEA|nr:extracellular calcium-sensing receptor-like [Protopterus annectens]
MDMINVACRRAADVDRDHGVTSGRPAEEQPLSATEEFLVNLSTHNSFQASITPYIVDLGTTVSMAVKCGGVAGIGQGCGPAPGKNSTVLLYIFIIEPYQNLQAMIFAINELNNNPQILPNLTLGFKMFDSCLSEVRALAGVFWMLSGVEKDIPNYECQHRPPLHGIVGDFQSNTALPIARVLGLYGYPQVGYGSTIEILSDKLQFPSYLRTMPNDKFQPPVLAHLVRHFSWNWVGIIASDNDYGLTGSQNLKKMLATIGVCVAFTELIPLSSSRQQVLRTANTVKKSSASVVIVYSTRMELLPLMEEISRQDVKGKFWIATISWIISTVFSNKETWGTLNGTLGLAIHRGEIAGFSDFLHSLHPSTSSDDIYIKSFWEEAFDCYWPTDEAGKESMKGGKMIVPCTGKEELESYDLSKFNLFDFRFAYNSYKAVYAIAHSLYNVVTCKPNSGPFVNKTCANIKDLKPWQLLFYIKNVFFNTTDGEEVFFDTNGDTPVMYDMLNWQAAPDKSTSKYIHVGYFNSRAPTGNDILINESLIIWSGGTTKPQGERISSSQILVQWQTKFSKIPRSVCSESCPPGTRKAVRRGEPICCFDCIPCSKGEINNQTDASNCLRCLQDQWPNHNLTLCIQKSVNFLSYEEPLGLTLTTVAFVFSSVCASVLYLFVKYRDTPIVKANNRNLSYLILISLFLCFLSSLIFIGRPKQLPCLFRQTAFGTIFSVCVSGVLAKTVTVVIAFKATKPDSNLRNYVGPKTPYSIVFGGSFLQISICTIWLAREPPFPEMNMKTEDGKIVMECNEGSVTMFYIMLGYLGILASVSFIVAFLARTLPDIFNEAKFISFSMIVFVTVWLSFIPAYLSTTGKYMVAVEIFAILASGTGIIVCIFFPKCYIILLRPSLNTRGQVMGNKSSIKNL